LFDGYRIISCASEAINEYISDGICSPCNTCRGGGAGGGSGGTGGGGPDSRNRRSNRPKTPPIPSNSPLAQTIALAHKDSNASSLTSGINMHQQHRNDKVLGIDTGNHTGTGINGINGKTTAECNDEEARAAAKAMAAETGNLWKPPPPPRTQTPTASASAKKQRPHPVHVPVSSTIANNTSQVPVTSEKRDRKRDLPPHITVTFNNNRNFSRSISELTMHSSLGEITEKISDARRMAYYAVGKHQATAKAPSGGEGSGGNRRCYFTGELIRGGQPFYAGSVQQGLRTLVVFCLPRALGLPKKEDLERISAMDGVMEEARSTTKSVASQKSRFSQKSRVSKFSSVWSDGAAMESYNTEWEEDDDGNLCETMKAEWLLQALPEPGPDLMNDMERRYPEQFMTLPQQVRSHSCWRLYMKFCFFSGLPIADGEMYYKVFDKITAKLGKQLYKAGIDEIILSHEVMEAVHGQSAEIVNLPTKKTFRYLQKHYTQQCTKLNDKAFRRASWEKVMPEV